MKGTRIIVLQLKELFKTIIFAVLGLGLVILLISLFMPKGQKSEPTVDLYIPGTYSSEIVLHSKPVAVSVTVSEKEILELSLGNMTEEQEVFYPLFKPVLTSISGSVIKQQSTNIDIEPEFEYTSQILLSAVDRALKKAELKAY